LKGELYSIDLKRKEKVKEKKKKVYPFQGGVE